jgi:hypothetical protein
MVEFRNNVIHKGQIPDLEETRAFGRYVYRSVFDLTEKLRGACMSSVVAVKLRQEAQKASSLPSGTKVVSHGGGLFFSLNSCVNEREFDAAIEKFLKARQAMAAVAACGVLRLQRNEETT